MKNDVQQLIRKKRIVSLYLYVLSMFSSQEEINRSLLVELSRKQLCAKFQIKVTELLRILSFHVHGFDSHWNI